MAQKKQPDLIILIVMYISSLLVIVSASGLFFQQLAGEVFIGGSIMLAGSLICRAMQWASEGKEE